MNWDQIAGKWSQLKGEIRQRWARLTDDDLEFVAGSRDKFVGRLQERYGIVREEAERQINEWAKAARHAEVRASRTVSQFVHEHAKTR